MNRTEDAKSEGLTQPSAFILHPSSPRRLATPTAIVLAAVVVIGLLRLGTLGTLALTDNTEARYASISWHMFRSGDWVTPRVYLSGKLVPFWAKPPLFFWMTTLSFETWGASEWAARLPNFLLALAIVGITIAFGRRFWNPRVGALAGLILASSGLFFVLAGSCILDMSLAASVCLALMSFALFAAADDKGAWWGRAFFFSLGLGGLAKGPIALVLVGLSLGAWIAAGRQWQLLRRLPWLSGGLILTLVACPWYLMAERATPGFLHYFLINEHIMRYIRSEYGDLYGAGRTQPYGASWLMLLVTFLPWSPLLLRYGIDRWRQRNSTPSRPRDAWLLFALIWGLMPALFFTFCRQILVTYLLPGFPGLALASAVIADRWLDSDEAGTLLKGLRGTCLGLGVLVITGLAAELVLGVAPWSIAGTLLAALVFFTVGWNGHQRADAASLFAAMGQGTALLVAIGIVTAAPWVEEAFSTKTILAAVARLPQYDRCAVYLPLGDEYSADFYQEAWLGRRLERDSHKGLKLLVDKMHESNREVFVFRRNDWQNLEGAIRDSLTPIAQTEHWVACHGNPAGHVAHSASTARQTSPF
jgi:4-amino-4-deoxy-L-arabinose transferase-like glycosyltransferase